MIERGVVELRGGVVGLRPTRMPDVEDLVPGLADKESSELRCRFAHKRSLTAAPFKASGNIA